MSLDTFLAVLSSVLSILTARIILSYFSTVLLVNRNLLTRLDSLLIFTLGCMITAQVFNRPGVAGAVLQTPPSLINSFIN